MENKLRNQGRTGLLAPTILILVGTILLLERQGLLDRHMVWQWMPLLPLCVGALLLVRRLQRRM